MNFRPLSKCPTCKAELKKDFNIDVVNFERAKDLLERKRRCRQYLQGDAAKPVLIGTAVVGAT